MAIPKWFNEGLAEYISLPYYTKNTKKLSIQKVKNFKDLNKATGINDAIAEGYDVYTQSYLAVKKVIELKGEVAIRNILLDLNVMDFYSSFQKNIGLSIEEFQKLIK